MRSPWTALVLAVVLARAPRDVEARPPGAALVCVLLVVDVDHARELVLGAVLDGLAAGDVEVRVPLAALVRALLATADLSFLPCGLRRRWGRLLSSFASLCAHGHRVTERHRSPCH